MVGDWQRLFECIPMLHELDVQVLPIVESSSSQLLFLELETERTDKPELGSNGQASAPNITRVLRYLGLMQNDV